MKRYLLLYLHFFKNCWIREIEFRFNLIIWTIMNMVWFGLNVALVEVIFGQVSAIAGWTKNEVLLLVFVQQLFADFTWTFFMQNMNNFSHLIRKGELDFVLLKPVNSRFWVSARLFEFDHYLRIIALIILIFRQLRIMSIFPSTLAVFGFLALFLLGLFIFYNFFFALTISNFWFVKLFNLENLFDEIIEVGGRPIDIFRGKTRLFFTFIIPIAFMATFPTKMLLGKGDWRLLLYGTIMALLFFVGSEWFWRFALKRYSSASS